MPVILYNTHDAIPSLPLSLQLSVALCRIMQIGHTYYNVKCEK